MPDSDEVAAHYTRDGLLEALSTGLRALGRDPAAVTVADLAPVDEFHIGGRPATVRFLDLLAVDPGDHALDVGCGLGGTARFAVQRYGCRVTGIDLTAAYVDAGNVLCDRVGLGDRIELRQSDATELAVGDHRFDKAWLLHVGMNIADKAALARSIFDALRPGGVFGVYDVMRIGPGELRFPVPWATTAAGSAVDTPEVYRQVLEAAGFEIVHECERLAFALEFFEALRSGTAAGAEPPPLGLHLLMGPDATMKVGNMIDNIAAGRIAPVEIVARRPG